MSEHSVIDIDRGCSAPRSSTAKSARAPSFDLEKLRGDCRSIVTQKYGERPTKYIASRLKAEYYAPEDQYEALLKRLVTPELTWLDVGCGQAPFPNNIELSAELSSRCKRLVGIDPDAAVYENPFVHERYQFTLEQYSPTCSFDLVTARMVVEHVTDPNRFVAALRRVTAAGSVVVIFTVNWWSISTVAAGISPFSVHHWVKRVLWGTDRQETFPTVYGLNQRRILSRTMAKAGFNERLCVALPDASLCWRVPLLRDVELGSFKLFNRLGMPYIDSCILAAYERCHSASQA
jgi:2-polyprenyl-3-methyl-5-hydroxy-6-metoxy-1,4-benzoquinol methylase